MDALAGTPWPTMLAALGGLLVGLWLVGTGDPGDEHRTFRSSELAVTWAMASVVALAQATGLAIALLPTWWHDVEAHWGQVAGLTVFVIALGALVFVLPERFRQGRGSGPGPDHYPIKDFRARETVFIVGFLIPVYFALTGLIGVALQAGDHASSFPHAQQDGTAAQAVHAFLELRSHASLYLLTAAVEVVAIVLLVAVAQRALTRALPQHRAYYRDSDAPLYGLLLTLLMAVMVVPAYVLLQQAGQHIAAAQLAEVPLDHDWFVLRADLTGELAPSALTSVGGTLAAVLAPVATGLLTGLLQRRDAEPSADQDRDNQPEAGDD